MKILRREKFIYGHRVYRAGEILPDGADTKFLEDRGIVEIIPENIPKKTRREKPTPAVTPPPVNAAPVENNNAGNVT